MGTVYKGRFGRGSLGSKLSTVLALLRGPVKLRHAVKSAARRYARASYAGIGGML